MISPSKDQAESFDYLFAGNNPHVKNFLAWIEDNLGETTKLMVQPDRDTNQMLRLAGSAHVLMILQKEVSRSKNK